VSLLQTQPHRIVHVIGLSLLVVLVFAGGARAEIPVAETNGWTFYIDGRLNAFLSHSRGDQLPDPQGNGLNHTLTGGGVVTDLDNTGDGKFSITRVKSGFLGDILGAGVRRKLSEDTTLTGYFALWSTIESNRQRFASTPIDVREAWLRASGSWGTFQAGRALGLYSRGHVEIDFLYAHGNGVGFPCTESGGVNGIGPACGQIGFGVIFPFFASGFTYATPSVGGLTATVGLYEPALVAGHWDRTPLPRGEGEVAYDATLGNKGKLHLFANGLLQQLGEHSTTRNTTVYGWAGGRRVELGPVRLGAGYYRGKGIGFSYAIENSTALYNSTTGNLRTFDGLYGQLMLVLGKIDLSAGIGQSRLHLIADDATVEFENSSFPKTQTGINAGIFYHLNEYVVLGFDFFQAKYTWTLGDKQTVNTGSLGVTFVW
jgi:hypothetical protein